jgi:hypothetical protein
LRPPVTKVVVAALVGGRKPLRRHLVLEIVVGLGEDLAIVPTNGVRRVEIVNIAEIKTQRPELRPDAKLGVDLRT